MSVHLTAKRRPMVFSNMSRAELVREAEHTFPNPSPIVSAMIQHLAGSVDPRGGMPVPDEVNGECQCPTCGAHLEVEVK